MLLFEKFLSVFLSGLSVLIAHIVLAAPAAPDVTALATPVALVPVAAVLVVPDAVVLVFVVAAPAVVVSLLRGFDD